MSDYWDDDSGPAALGTVLTDERGSLPFLLVHGEALAAAAAWALGESGVLIVDSSVEWASIQEADEPFVLHDSLCPLTPPAFIAACVERSAATGAVVVGVRPVTDTVKHVDDDGAGPVVGATVDRETLAVVCSPVVLPAAVVAALPAPPTLDLTELVATLRASYDVVTVEAPPTAARVSGPDDVRLLEALRET